jgi:hypothetical protein
LLHVHSGRRGFTTTKFYCGLRFRFFRE